MLTWDDWKEWVDPEGSMFGEHGEWEDDESGPPLRPFKVENSEGVVEEGRPRAKKQRDLWIPGLGLEPVEYTAGGWPAASAAVLRGVAGDPTADPPRYGTAYQHFGGGEPGHTACSALHSLVTVGAIDTMLSNFILPLQTMADENLRVHCSLNLNTDTGRLSARRPNLQNQPALEKVSSIAVAPAADPALEPRFARGALGFRSQVSHRHVAPQCARWCPAGPVSNPQGLLCGAREQAGHRGLRPA